MIITAYLFQSICPGAKIGFNKAMAKGWLSIDKKAECGPKVMRKVFMDSIKRDKVCNKGLLLFLSLFSLIA